MKKNVSAGKKPRKHQPAMKWQTGVYERFTEFKFILPYQFLLLCRLVDTTPEQALLDFMDNLSCGSWKREGRDEAKKHLLEYFIAHGYGQQHYSEADIREIFREMDAVGLLFPKDANNQKVIDRYSKWRKKHHSYWFKKWFRKPRRKISKRSVL